MQRVVLIATVILSLAACEQPAPQPESGITVLPCGGDFASAEGFEEFMAGFRQAVLAQDREYIASILAPDIKFDFGGGQGKEAFLREWNIRAEDDPAKSPLWDELIAVLQLGGYMESSEAVVFPCTFRDLPEDNWLRQDGQDHSAFDYMVVTRDNAVLKNEGRVLRKLRYGETVRLAAGGDTGRFTTHDGLEGEIESTALRSPVDYRAFFTRQADGRWLLTLFIAGD